MVTVSPDHPLAVVIGDMDLVRPLGLAGIPVVAAGPTGPETRWSKHVVGHLELPDLWEEPAATVDALIEFARKQPTRPVLLYQKDPAVLAISRHREALRPWFDFVVPEADLVEDLVDKERFRARAERCDLPVPRTTSFICDETGHVGAGLRFPVIVKPAVRNRPLDTWIPVAGNAKAHLCDSRSELSALLRRPEMAGVEIMVQDFVPGPEDRIWSYHAFIDENRTVRAEFTGRKIRTWPLEFGQSTAVEIIGDSDVRDTGRCVLRRLDFTGVAKVDFKRNDAGELFLLEVNPRFSLWHHPGAVAGVNIPAAVVRHLTSTDVAPMVATDGVRWCQVWNDWRAAHASGVSTRQWLSFVESCRARRAAHPDDVGSMLGALAYAVSKDH